MKRKFILSNLIKIAVVFACLFALNVSVEAQKRRTTKPKTNTTTNVANTNANAEIRSGAEKVSVQIKNLTKFIFNLGGIARVIEDLDREIAAKKASQNAPGINSKNKEAVLQSLRNVRAGLVQLEVDFRAKPELKNYNAQILGIADLSAQAEDLAVSGRFSESGKPLLLIVEKLADTLATMP